MHQRDKWYDRSLLCDQGQDWRGQKAYCEKMVSQWEEYARLAAFKFRKANPDFPDTWTPIITQPTVSILTTQTS